MFDVLVVGGGIAGLRAAVEARRQGVQTAIITKVHPLRSYSITIQDGINAALEDGDSWEEHAADTVRSGDYLADQDLVEEFCQEAPQVIQELDAMGVPFHRDGVGGFAQLQLAGSERPWTCFVHDMTGHAVTQVLYEQALKEDVQFIEEWYVVSLVVEERRCRGVVAVELATGKMEIFSARSVVLATGGARRLYEPSTSSLLCNADGIGLAYRAGAGLMDMEMVQYHPCVMNKGRLALSELLLAAGGEVVDDKERRVSAVEAQPWGHSLARALAQEITAEQASDGYLLFKAGITPQDAVSTFYSTSARIRMFLQRDLAQDPIPVAPAMHRLLGGVTTDSGGLTTLLGLFAAGECASGGFHGAGALDGNSLLTSVVSGRRTGETASQAVGEAPGGEPSHRFLVDQEEMRHSLLARQPLGSLAAVRHELAILMHRHVGLTRDASGLQKASQEIQQLRQNYFRVGLKNQASDYNYELMHYYEVGTLLDAAEAVVASATARQESRGVHQRSDFPARDDAQWSKHILVQRSDSGLSLSERPVRITRWPAHTTAPR